MDTKTVRRAIVVATAVLVCALVLERNPTLTSAAPAAVDIWPDGAPGALGRADVDRPAIVPYLPSASTNTGAAVLVIPGGGFTKLNADSEGAQVAAWLNGQGIAAFVLRHRLMPRYQKDSALADTIR